METNQVLLTPIPVDVFINQILSTINHAFETKQRKEFEEKLLTAVEACKVFVPAIAKSTLHQWTAQGLIPVHRIGGRIFYKYSEIIEAAKRVRKYDRDKQVA
jgi:hypothetical protein